jgi:hypothetical protein
MPKSPLTPIDSPHCAKCGASMTLVRLAPNGAGSRVQMFECAKCGNTISVEITDPLKEATAGWPAAICGRPTDCGLKPLYVQVASRLPQRSCGRVGISSKAGGQHACHGTATSERHKKSSNRTDCSPRTPMRLRFSSLWSTSNGTHPTNREWTDSRPFRTLERRYCSNS